MINGIFDTHAHYDEACFNGRRDEVFRTQREKGVSLIINSGSNLPSSQRSVDMAEKYDFIYAAVGVYPVETGSLPAGWLNEIERIAGSSKKVVSIGEIGLDYFAGEPRPAGDIQRRAFREQLALAKRLSLPVEIHDRDADEDTVKILEESRPQGMIHRFNSSVQSGRRFLELGLYLSIGPAITYSGADNIRTIVKEMPPEFLLLETDAPFLPIASLAGQIALSDMIGAVAESIAALRGDLSAQEVVDIARENGKKLFSVKGVL